MFVSQFVYFWIARILKDEKTKVVLRTVSAYFVMFWKSRLFISLKEQKTVFGTGSQVFRDCLFKNILPDDLFSFSMIFGNQGILIYMACRKSISKLL